MYRKLIPGAFLLCTMSSAASAQVAVDDVRLQLFKERSGTLSENIVGSRKSFVKIGRAHV